VQVDRCSLHVPKQWFAGRRRRGRDDLNLRHNRRAKTWETVGAHSTEVVSELHRGEAVEVGWRRVMGISSVVLGESAEKLKLGDVQLRCEYLVQVLLYLGKLSHHHSLPHHRNTQPFRHNYLLL